MLGVRDVVERVRRFGSGAKRCALQGERGIVQRSGAVRAKRCGGAEPLCGGRKGKLGQCVAAREQREMRNGAWRVRVVLASEGGA